MAETDVGLLDNVLDASDLHGRDLLNSLPAAFQIDVLQALPAAVYITDAAGRIIFYNRAAADLWAHQPELGKSAWCGSWRLYWPDGRPMAHDECPMAVALREGRPIKGAEAIAERPDGTRVPFLAYPTPLRDRSGTLIGAVNTLIDITSHRRAAEIEQLLAAIVESSDDAIVSKDLSSIIKSWNRGAEQLFGYSAAEIIGKPITTLIPPDRQDEEKLILDRILRGEPVENYETVRQRKDGSLIHVSVTVSPVKSYEGKIVGASKIARDITERRQSQERQRLLLREINHRVKNLFALAGAVVALSARSAQSPEDLADAVRERLGALAQAHELTLPDLANGEEKAHRATELSKLVRAIVSPYLDAHGDGEEQVVMNGPDIPIAGSAIASLALLLHEFAANAAKYGALSSPHGRVTTQWTVENDKFLLTWRERGGPALQGPPQREGFGSFLCHATVTHELDGEIIRDWRPEGLTVRLSVPVEHLTE